MREIKFRAWLKEKKIMVEVSEINFIFGRVEYIINKIKKLVYTQSDKLEKFILMQYTGLKDKNGVEIYEGDIVRVPDVADSRKSFNGYVKYEEDRAEFVIDLLDGFEETFYCCNQNERIKVVGNIYENKELLEDD